MSLLELLQITWLTLRVGVVATLLVFVPGVSLGYVLARGRFPGRRILRTFVLLPMVLPPVAVGLILLRSLSRDSVIGRVLESLFDGPILLTWWAAAIASAAMSFPLLALGAEQGFASVPRRLEQVAATLGADRWRIFRRVTLPLAARSIFYGTIFAFARALGEFGATTLVAGHIPGKTETLALAIYAAVQEFDDRRAALLALVSASIAFLMIMAAETLLRPPRE